MENIKNAPKEQRSNALCDFLEVIVSSIAIVLIIFTFFGRIAVVDGTSMTNTLQHKDRLVVSNFLYTPKQGDIIVCQTEFFGFEEPIVKRVIACEGQKVSIDTEKWAVYVDGEKIDEDYVRCDNPNVAMKGWFDQELDADGCYTVPEGCVFCMGDNRNGSWDCRWGCVGPIDERYIVGKVLVRLFPGFTSFLN